MTDIDDCDHNPCENGGTCIDGINAYSCECDAGYFGDICGIDLGMIFLALLYLLCLNE